MSDERPGIFSGSIIPDEGLPELSDSDIQRYSRHLILPQVGVEGQKKLKKAKVLLIGSGALGSPIALYLAAAGVGTLGVVDFDEVEESNLQRQVIHSTRDVGRPKVASAKDRIRSINPKAEVIVYNLGLTRENALEIFADYDVIVDGTDNFQTRYLINDACVMLGKPEVYGSVFQFEGLASVFYAKHGPCYRCLYPEPPPPGLVPSCGEAGVFGALPGIIGTIQATEVIKLIIGGAEPLIGRLLSLDGWSMRFREYALKKDPSCPVCGRHPTIKELVDYEEFCGLKKHKEIQINEIEPKDLKQRLDNGEPIQLIDIREVHERAIARLEGVKTIPFGQVLRRKDELDKDIDAVFICKVGQKSLYIIEELIRAGYEGKLISLKGGINGWARDVDPSIPLY